MSKAAMARSQSRRRQEEAAQHFHLPSVHVRNGNGDGYDYNEDYLHYHLGGRERRAEKRKPAQKPAATSPYNPDEPDYSGEWAI